MLVMGAATRWLFVGHIVILQGCETGVSQPQQENGNEVGRFSIPASRPREAGRFASRNFSLARKFLDDVPAITSRELRPIVVAIPVRDEEERIGQCLAALSQQNEFQADHVVLLVNNTIDDSIAIARQRPMPAGTLPAHQASAGYARRLAMQQVAEIR